MSTNEPITVELSDQQVDNAVTMYVMDNFRPETQQVFQEHLTTSDVKTALLHAVFNEWVNDLFENELTKEQPFFFPPIKE